MANKRTYTLVLSLIQLTVGALSLWTIIKVSDTNYLQLTMYIAIAIFGFFLGTRGIIKFFQNGLKNKK